MDIKLSPDTEKRLHGSIQRFVAEEYGESLGELGASTFLRFCLKELGPAIYNQAISDAQAMLRDRKSTRLNSSHSDRSRMPSSA